MSKDAPRGHIKLARKMFDADHGDEWWNEKREFSRFEAWVDVIHMAAWKQRRQGDAMLERGEFVASLRTLARRWGWSVKKVRSWILGGTNKGKLRAQREVQAGTVYLIVNYDMYQSGIEAKGTPGETQKGTAGAQEGHKKEAVKQLNRTTTPGALAYDQVFDEAWAAYPKRPNNSKADAWRAWLARVGEGVEPLDMLAGTRAYGAYITREKPDPRFIKLASTFFGPGRHFTNDYAPTPDQFAHLDGYPNIVDEYGQFTAYGERVTRPAGAA